VVTLIFFLPKYNKYMVKWRFVNWLDQNPAKNRILNH
jgi:hypothetical protein